jgi:DNA-binding transcriptional regulator LsrR (DeoR family)
MLQQKRWYRHMDYAKAEKIRELYFTRQMKQAELAEAFGLRQGTISRIVSGRVWQTPPAP